MIKQQLRKSQGFAGERVVEVPRDGIAKCLSSPFIKNLFIARMGFYPKALHHYFQRPSGISQVIFLYCTDGEGWIQLPMHRVVLRANEVFAIAPGTPHSYGADTTKPWTIYWFHFQGQQGNEVVRLLMGSGKPIPLSIPYTEERILLLKRLLDNFLEGYSLPNLLFANLTLSFMLASFILPEKFREKEADRNTINASGKAIRYMQENLASPVTLDNIARSAALSVSFFCRLFKKETGYAPIEYYNHLRIQKACQLLLFSNLRINEIAMQIGIEDQFYFSRLFKKQLGISPLEYRKREGILIA